MSLIDEFLASILVCPVDKGELDEDVAESRLVCRACGRRYPVTEGIPVMLPDDAEGGPGD